MKELRTREVFLPHFNLRRVVIEPECFLPVAAPGGWRAAMSGEDGGVYEHRCADGRLLVVILSAAVEDDGAPWLHLSISKRPANGGMKRGLLPDWGELMYAKDSFIGPDKLAVQVLPRATNHVNLADVLHLWHRLDGVDFVPDFTSGTGSI